MRYLLVGVGLILFGILFRMNSVGMEWISMLVGVAGLGFLLYGYLSDKQIEKENKEK